MTFRRSASGLSNLHLFLNSDAVVFLEGGESLTREEVDQGQYSEASSDIRYWQSLFRVFRPGGRLEFRSVGSKSVVQSIAADVCAGRVRNVIAAMDRDYEDVIGTRFTCNNVVYTYGYAWENDCWRAECIADAVISIAGLTEARKDDVLKETERCIDEFCKAIRHAVKADCLLIQNGKSLFDRGAHLRYISTDRRGRPSANREQIRAAFAHARRATERTVRLKHPMSISAAKDCYGHLVGDFCYRVLGYVLRQCGWVVKIPKDVAISFVVEKFMALLRSNAAPDLVAHYRSEFARVTY